MPLYSDPTIPASVRACTHYPRNLPYGKPRHAKTSQVMLAGESGVAARSAAGTAPARYGTELLGYLSPGQEVSANGSDRWR